MIRVEVRTRLGQFLLDARFQTAGVACLAGRNGSGKTSLLKTMAGLLEVDQGRIEIGGVDVTHLPAEKRRVVMVTPTSFFPHLDVDSHILWGAKLAGRSPSKEEIARVKSDLGIDFGGPVRKLSLGMHERVALATALLASPRAILVDEVFASLHDRKDFVAAYGRLSTGAGIDLVFSSQDEADGGLAGHLLVMDDGTVSARS